MKTMKAFITRSCGPEARFEAADIPVPVPASGQILIEVKATSLNPVDNVFLRQDIGMNPGLPAVLHGDVAGVVSAVGQGVEGFKRGDEVFACAGGFRGHGGALAEFMAADARLVAALSFILKTCRFPCSRVLVAKDKVRSFKKSPSLSMRAFSSRSLTGSASSLTR